MTSPVYSDYVTCYIKDVYEETPSGLVWKIPPDAYYYKDKGTLCKVSLADAVLETDGAGDQNIAINYVGTLTGGLNEQLYTNKIENYAGTLGIFRYISGGAYTWNIGNSGAEPIKLVTAARPDKITLTFVEGNKNYYNFDVQDQDGVFILRFDYYDEVIENQINYDVSYKAAFPEPNPF